MRLASSILAVAAVAAFAVPTFAAQADRDASFLSSFSKGEKLPFVDNGSIPSTNTNEATVTVDLTGFQTFNGGFPGALNSQLLVPVSPLAQITGVSFSNLSIQLENGSFGGEFVLSTNDSANLGNAGTFWDYRPFPTDDDDPAVLGPISGSFTAPSNQFNSGPFPLLADGNLLLYVYETFNDAGNARDAVVLSGTLTITYTPIPEPATLGALAAVGLVALRRRK